MVLVKASPLELVPVVVWTPVAAPVTVVVKELPWEFVPVVTTPKMVRLAETKLVTVLPSVVRVVYTPSVEIGDPTAPARLETELKVLDWAAAGFVFAD